MATIDKYNKTTCEWEPILVDFGTRTEYYIGENGNWFVSGEDTGKRAEVISIKQVDIVNQRMIVTFTDGSVYDAGTISSNMNYEISENKPQINGKTLESGENTLDEIGVTKSISDAISEHDNDPESHEFILTQIEDETKDRIEVEKALATAISEETKARINAVDSVSEEIAQEVENRRTVTTAILQGLGNVDSDSKERDTAITDTLNRKIDDLELRNNKVYITTYSNGVYVISDSIDLIKNRKITVFFPAVNVVPSPQLRINGVFFQMKTNGKPLDFGQIQAQEVSDVWLSGTDALLYGDDVDRASDAETSALISDTTYMTPKRVGMAIDSHNNNASAHELLYQKAKTYTDSIVKDTAALPIYITPTGLTFTKPTGAGSDITIAANTTEKVFYDYSIPIGRNGQVNPENIYWLKLFFSSVSNNRITYMRVQYFVKDIELINEVNILNNTTAEYEFGDFVVMNKITAPIIYGSTDRLRIVLSFWVSTGSDTLYLLAGNNTSTSSLVRLEPVSAGVTRSYVDEEIAKTSTQLNTKFDSKIPNEPTAGKVLISDGTNNNKWIDFEEQFLSYYAYGVERDMALPATTYRRIGNMQLHRDLPIHNKLRRCILKDDGMVNYYLSGEKTQGNLYKGDDTWNVGNSIFTKTGDVIRGQANTTTTSTPYIQVFLGGSIVANKDYKLSFYGRADKVTSTRRVLVRRALNQEYLAQYINYTTEWKRYEFSFNSTSDVSGTRELIFIVGAGGAPGNVTDWIELRGIKLEQLPMKADGTTANLDGTDGQYMVEIPKGIYMRYDTIPNTTKYRVLCSEYSLPGFHLATPTPLYVSAVEPTVDRTLGISNALVKLSSVCNTASALRGGVVTTTEAWDNTYRTLIGRPASGGAIGNYRIFARNRSAAGRSGVGWNIYTYEIHKLLYWLYTIEYANTNCQLPFIEERDANGFKQGGLGSGVTTLSSSALVSFNSSYPFIPCGHTNSLGNQTGTVPFTMPVEYNNGVPHTVNVPSYRGVENWFGHLNAFTDGVFAIVDTVESGNLPEAYVTDDVTEFGSLNKTTYAKKSDLSISNGSTKTIILGENGDIFAKTVGGSSSTYFSDNYNVSPPASVVQERVLAIGAPSTAGEAGGISYLVLSNSSSHSSSQYGTRLTFYPELPE